MSLQEKLYVKYGMEIQYRSRLILKLEFDYKMETCH